MAKTINEQIVELQSENDRLKKLQKLFENFLAVFCSENSLNYFKNHRKK